ncbi:MAG: hypothetical protein V3S41_08620, partial [Spirochaetia bacterium]
FHRLDKDQILKIVDLELAKTQTRLDERKLTLQVDEKAKRHLAEIGFDPAFGARPLKRAIQNKLQNALAKDLLAGTFTDGNTISVTVSGGELVFDAGPSERRAI